MVHKNSPSSIMTTELASCLVYATHWTCYQGTASDSACFLKQNNNYLIASHILSTITIMLNGTPFCTTAYFESDLLGTKHHSIRSFVKGSLKKKIKAGDTTQCSWYPCNDSTACPFSAHCPANNFCYQAHGADKIFSDCKVTILLWCTAVVMKQYGNRQ